MARTFGLASFALALLGLGCGGETPAPVPPTAASASAAPLGAAASQEPAPIAPAVSAAAPPLEPPKPAGPEPVVKFTGEFLKPESAPDLQAAADIGYDTKRGRLLVPLLTQNVVLAYELK